jgi:hypothetical protein
VRSESAAGRKRPRGRRRRRVRASWAGISAVAAAGVVGACAEARRR